MTENDRYGPANWLRELTKMQPARWDWGRAVRSAVAIALPMALGLALNEFAYSLLISLGALTTVLGDGEGSYRSRFRQIIISSLIGSIGFLAGYLMVLPFPVVILLMAMFAFLAGIVNSYGAAYSIGTMQALLYAAAAIGMPQIGPFWQPAVLSLVGVALYLAMLGVEAAVDRRRPEREMMVDLALNLSRLSDVRRAVVQETADQSQLEEARRAVTDHIRALYKALLLDRRNGRTHETLSHADFLDAADTLFAALMAEEDPEALAAASHWLASLSRAIARKGSIAPLTSATRPHSQRLADAVAALAGAAASDAVVPRCCQAALPCPRLPRGELSLPHMTVGKAVIARAFALSLCIAIAYASRYFVHESHWYWMPLTVAMAMKPDLGSVFVRAVLRSIGTSAGVVLGAAVLMLLPKGYGLVAALAFIGAFLPYAKSLSYGVQTLVLTPLVLILLDLIAPTLQTVDLGGQRLLATVVGGVICLIFGYYIWPRAHASELANQLDAALSATSDYLLASLSDPPPQGMSVISAEREAYAQLSDLRAALGNSMAEPPPAGKEAAAWFPLVAAAERLCDRITVAEQTARAKGHRPQSEVAFVADRLRRVVAEASGRTSPVVASTALNDPDLRAILVEANHLADKLERTMPSIERPSFGGALQPGPAQP